MQPTTRTRAAVLLHVTVVAASVLRPGLRLSERVKFPENLPITASVIDIANAIDGHQVIIIAGETGSGKTTQLPKICLAMGRAEHAYIGCTQPRRIAATSVAARVAEELGTQVGDVVGYKVRFNDKVSQNSYVKFMTDGILLAEIQGDPMLRAYDTIIVDEAHERSLNIDFLLGFLKQLLPRRPELRVIVSSATLELERFSKFFGDAPVIEVSGRTYPVDVFYRPPTEEERDLSEVVANTVNEITEMDPRGDILVFLPGEREIREAVQEIEQRALPHTVVLPLYARLSPQDQQRVFHTLPQRRVVLATNVAETSLTIPGIVYVVDAGVARVNRYNVRTGVTQLLIEPVSRASADQRKGRCGRTQHGVCFRLYEEQDYITRPSHTDPEIQRVGLAGVILRMKSLRLTDIESFPFLDPPQKRAIDEGYRVLEEIGAMSSDGELTELGHHIGRLPLDPRLSRMILGGRDENALREVVVIAAALGLQDPRDRPHAAQQKADEAHRQFRDEGSDFIAYLKIWETWQAAKARSTKNQLYKFARENFLNFNRMREWEDIHAQIVRTMKELDFRPNEKTATGEQIHRALLPGLLSKIGMWNVESRIYIGARQTKWMIHPSSALAKKPPQWVMAAELVETSQLFARGVAKIDPLWIEGAAGSLCKRSYGDPHWDPKTAQVSAKEQVTLYGLPIVKERRVNYAQFDPKLCRDLFITHALVRGEYATKGAFADHNRRLFLEVEQLRDKARRSDMLADETSLWEFFDSRLPDEIVSGKTFEDWRRTAEAKDPHILELSRADLLLDEAAELSPERYPDHITKARLRLTYKFEPGEEDDGITATIPLAQLPQLDPDLLEWTIGGYLQAKVFALFEALTKNLRRALAATLPLEQLATKIVADLQPFEGAFLPALERAVLERTGERVARDAWDLRAVPGYTRTTFRIVDDHEKVIAQGKELFDLQRTLARRANELWEKAPRAAHERKDLRQWDFEALPATVTLEIGNRATLAYPALVAVEHGVDLKLLESAAAANAATREALRKLILYALGTTLVQLDAKLPATLSSPLGNYKRQLVLRALDEAFQLTNPDDIPRTKAAFAERVSAGRLVLQSITQQLERLASPLVAELEKVRALMKPLASRPGPTRAALDDIQLQISRLVPHDLMRETPAGRLLHITRYLKALTVRLQRLAHDPNKDQAKAASIGVLVQGFGKKRDELLAKNIVIPEIEEFGWLLEELRVQTFAPEIKTAVSISLPRLQDQWAKLR